MSVTVIKVAFWSATGGLLGAAFAFGMPMTAPTPARPPVPAGLRRAILVQAATGGRIVAAAIG